MPFGARIWRVKWGSGIAAKEGFLLTTGHAMPAPIAWSPEFQTLRDFLDCKIGHEDVVDLTGHAQGLFLRGIGSNLLFPVHLRTGKPADEEHFAAAHFVDSPFGPEALAFCILTRHGLMAVTQDASLAQMRFESETNHARR
jgi:hypothetical protein